jgi:hypothetical protein
MKNAIHLLTAIALVAFIAGCGALIGEDPEGVTGGHEGGYGSLGTGYDGYYGPDIMLVGSWERGTIGSTQYETMQFNADGKYVHQICQNGTMTDASNGQFSISGDKISIASDGAAQSGSFSVNGATLTITLDGQSSVWTKM